MSNINSLQKAKSEPILATYVQNMMARGEIKKALPATLTPERFTRVVLSAISNNKDLQNCSPKTFLAAMMQSAQLGLEPNTPLGQAYLIPYKDNCSFQIGYQGILDLAWRSQQYQRITAETVHENDTFEYELGMNPLLKHVPAKGSRGEAIAYYATYTLKNGGQAFAVMTKEEVEDFKNKYSKAKNSPWLTAFDAMAKKTVLKQLLKYAPKTIELAKAINTDSTVREVMPNSTMEDLDVAKAMDLDFIDAELKDTNVNQDTGEILEEPHKEAPSLL